MPKYPEYQPLFQSDNSIGSLLWPYMMSSCLTELMSSPFPSRMNGLPPCRIICYLLEHRSPPCKDERRRIQTHNSQYVHHQLLTASRSQLESRGAAVVSASRRSGVHVLSLRRRLHQLSSSSAPTLHEHEVLPPYLCLSTQPSELSSSICVSRHNPYGDPLR